MFNLGKLDNEDIVMVEFRKEEGKDELVPWEITTQHGEYSRISRYDIEYTKTYGYYCYSLSGSGGNMSLWHPDAFYLRDDHVNQGVCENFSLYSDKRLIEFPLAQEKWDEFLEQLIEGETVYCSECDDRLPERAAYRPCEHVWYCDDCSQYSTPDERCECKEEEEDENDRD